MFRVLRWDDACIVAPDVALEERTQLRQNLRCKSFELSGRRRMQECIYHEGNPVGDKILAVMRSCAGPGGSQNEGPEAMNWCGTNFPLGVLVSLKLSSWCTFCTQRTIS
eukprot:m.755882 g.755882  ORF g.755882 m.755882 type:complete len:109 (-) comp23183_c0_seq30:1059-1385(-)